MYYINFQIIEGIQRFKECFLAVVVFLLQIQNFFSAKSRNEFNNFFCLFAFSQAFSNQNMITFFIGYG